ncbi:unnamed product [Ostreococcus tauri]|uniref:Unnamed product n=1 Tax=Ostreococcus tauri TaxID=70448 RepID=Q00SQ5_OSTTA|nr:unnamed product [Ostreococcus tauri]OUS45157.1 hypothetical protein BE221DRAFT_193343 [Ostreococcus tauri]CAL58559.1 unnamed product [Ostreococcus tauri]|eukprot:XP_003084143.1 unnamed product [Ostreococcus tauri]
MLSASTAVAPGRVALSKTRANARGHRVQLKSRSYVTANASKAEKYDEIDKELSKVRALPPSERAEALEIATSTVRGALNAMREDSWLWNSALKNPQRRNVFPNELKRVLKAAPEQIAKPSDANDLKLIVTVTLTCSLAAVVVGATLPGDIGAFGAYLLGGIPIVVLAVGSTAPGLLRVATDRLARVDPEYRRRIARHEAGHFLVGYACGVPVGSYNLGIDESHVNFMESKLERKIFQGAKLSSSEVLPLAVISMAGVAAEAMEFEEVMGQSADLFDLQRILNRVDPKLNDASQQEITRWAVFQAATILSENRAAFDALTEKMQEGASVVDCLQTIEAKRA